MQEMLVNSQWRDTRQNIELTLSGRNFPKASLAMQAYMGL